MFKRYYACLKAASGMQSHHQPAGRAAL